MERIEDEILVRQILSRDRRALLVFYQTYAPKLGRYIKNKVANPSDAEEILQDTLFAFLEALRDFQGNCRVQTFLFSICSHKIVDYYRRRKLALIVFSRMPEFESLVSPLLGPEEELDSTLLKEKIHRVLSKLLPGHRQVLLFKYMDNLSVEEIARKLTVTFKSAESQLFRARKAFVEIYTNESRVG